MTRKESRTSAFQLVFQQGVNVKTMEDLLAEHDDQETPLDEFSIELIRLTIEHLPEIDEAIRPHLKRWTLKRIPKVSLAILRLSCAQLFYMNQEVPSSVVINEAVELAKTFGSDVEYAFINGTLRSIFVAQAGESV